MMADDQFQPKLGRVRSPVGRKNQRYLNRVVRDISRAAQPKFRNGRSKYSGSRSGRGYSAAAAQNAFGFQQGRRRVVVKARFTRLKNGGLGAARAHLRYIQRDGVTREGEPGELYGPDIDQADGRAFLAEAEGDRHQFRFIVAPEDGAQLDNLKPFIRDLMLQAEKDLGTKLEWVAVDHFNTGHPHTHIVIRGKDDLGKDLVIARDYMSHGFRERARDLVTLELGPETQIELDRKLQAEMIADRFTRIDQALLRDEKDGVLTINRASQSQQWQSLKTGRLHKLETMGLAEELKPGIWKVAERTGSILRDLGQRNDIVKTMQRVLKDADIERGTHDMCVFKADDPKTRAVGRIIGMGLSDEINNRHYVIVDGIDGKLHYANIGLIKELDPPGKGNLVTLRGQQQVTRSVGKLNLQARLFIEAHLPFEQLSTAHGATWLDRQLLSKDPERLASRGFGTEAAMALRQRQQWLVQEELMTPLNGQLIAQRQMLAHLIRRNVAKTGTALEKRLNAKHVNVSELGTSGAKIVQSVRLTSGRFAIVQKSKEFALVPWQQAMRLRKAKGLGIEIGKGISR
jgi:type IV secretory pathway VirD2 relaxase